MDEIKGLQIGDTIECASASDLLETMYDLSDAGYDTDFLYEKDGREGLWLVVTGYDKMNLARSLCYAKAVEDDKRRV